MIKANPRNLSFQSLTYLSKAIAVNPLPDDPTIWDILDDCANGEGEIYTWSKGAVYIETYPDLLNVALLGGDDVNEWKGEFVKFIRNLLKEKGIKHVSVLGRQGWSRIFKELKPIGTLYIAEGGEGDKP